MTRFKELRRLEHAIKNAHKEELEWAAALCQQRLSMATMKHHQKHWRKLMKQVDTAIAELDEAACDPEQT